MTIAEMRAFLALADKQGVHPDEEIKVLMNGQTGVYAITACNVQSSVTNTPTLGIKRMPTTLAELDEAMGLVDTVRNAAKRQSEQ